MHRTVRFAAALATTVVLLGACGSASDSSSAPAAPAATAAPAGQTAPGAVAGGDGDPAQSKTTPAADGASAADALPNTLVHNVADDQLVKMADFVTAGTPVLVWFWAPH